MVAAMAAGVVAAGRAHIETTMTSEGKEVHTVEGAATGGDTDVIDTTCGWRRESR